MENWPRIPRQQSGSAPQRSGASSLPPPGSVIMASVEEDLGEGMYALRWAGNRIAVSSRAALSPGQSLILKSELSPEGKPTLVVQGPALPDASALVSGGVVYGRGDRGRGASEKADASDREDASGRAGREASGRPAGGEMAAGVVRAGAGTPAKAMESWIGLVLEPLEDFSVAAARLLIEAEKETELLKNIAPPAREKTAPSTEDASASASSSKTQPGKPAEVSGERGRAEGQTPPASEPAAAPAAKTVSDASVGATLVVARDATGNAAAPSQKTPAGESAPQPSDPTTPLPEPSMEGGRPQGPPLPSSDPTGGRTEVLEQMTRPGAAPARPDVPVPPAEPPAAAGREAAENAAAPEQGSPPPSESPPGKAAQAERPPPDIRPEVFVKEALGQLIKAVELPLSGSSAAGQALGSGGKMPEAVAEKAAGILLRAAGLTPDSAALEAAKALVDNGVQVDRQTVQALIALAAGAEEADRTALLKAAARLAARDIPLAAPLVEGLAEVMGRKPGVHELVGRAVDALADPPDLPEAAPLMRSAREILALLHVDLDSADAGLAIERYVSTFGREALGKTLALVEKSAQAVLENHPLLPKIDRALTAILLQAEKSMIDAEALASDMAGKNPAAPAAEKTQIPGRIPAPETPAAGAASPPSGDEAPSWPPAAPIAPATPAAPAEPGRQAAATGAFSPINAYLKAPRAFPGLAALNLPPMPKVARIPQSGMAPAEVPAAPAASDETPSAPAAEGGRPERPVPPVFDPATGKSVTVDQPIRPGAVPFMPNVPDAPIDAGASEASVGATLVVARDATGNPVAPMPQTPAGEPAPQPSNPTAPPPEPSAEGGRPQGPPLPLLDPAGGKIEALDWMTRPEAAPARPAAPAPSAGATLVVAPEPAESVPPPSPTAPTTPTTPSESANPPLPSPPPEPGKAGGTVPFDPQGPPPQPATPESGTPSAAADRAPRQPAAPQPGTGDSAQAKSEPRLPPEPMFVSPEREARSSLLMKLDAIFSVPGLNKPELELLRPGGPLDSLFNPPAKHPGGGAGEKAAAETRSEAGALARDLLSEDPEKREKALRELPRRDPETLREAARNLGRMEREILRSEPLLNRLSDAASSLRDLGRQLLAVKAENLAGQNRDPGVMLAEVPFKLADDAGDGRMQMFYRRSKRKQDGWTSRVILDLNTTGMGPVLGDMRFFGQDMVLNMFVEKAETASFLAESGEALEKALLEKGFRLKSRFLVLPPPPQIAAARPEIREAAAEVPSPSPAVPGRRGRLDVKG